MLNNYEQKQNMIKLGPHCVWPQNKCRAGTPEPDDPNLLGAQNKA